MKINQVYSNKDELFPRLRFNSGLNVIYAKVSRPGDSTKDSHNLGKTTLLHLIDFLLLRGWSKGLFLYDKKARFEEFVFFLELKLNAGGYVTIRRSVESNSKINLERHSESSDLSGRPVEDWEHSRVPLEKAKSLLNEILSLSSLGEWSYRKGVGYFLRTQNDYRDVFQLQRFMRGRDNQWKPYLASILGFNALLLEEKYKIDQEIKEDSENLGKVRQRSDSSYDKVKGLMEIKREETERLGRAIDAFSFHASDMQHNAELVDEIEQEVAAANTRAYVIDYEIDKITSSLQKSTIFDLDKVERLFREANLVFPQSLERSYGDLVQFNERLAVERTARLSRLRSELVAEREALSARLRDLDDRRSKLMSVVQETDTLAKFRTLQKDLVQRESEIVRLKAELEQLDEAAKVEKSIREKKNSRQEKILEIEEQIRLGNSRYTSIRTGFNHVMRTVLDRIAVISVETNQEGNLDFAVNLQQEGSGSLTSEDKGTSYKKLLCAAFDIALLLAYEEDSFFRFVYHDGVLEGLDNRKKNKFLSIVREVCDDHGMQYILTLIDADIPRDENDQRVTFQESEILRELYEGSDEGRLFRMPRF